MFDISYIIICILLERVIIRKAIRLYKETKALLLKESSAYSEKSVYYFFEASNDTFLNSFNSFSKSRELLRAREPAALVPFSICKFASVAKASNSALILLTSSSIFLFICLVYSWL